MEFFVTSFFSGESVCSDVFGPRVRRTCLVRVESVRARSQNAARTRKWCPTPGGLSPPPPGSPDGQSSSARVARWTKYPLGPASPDGLSTPPSLASLARRMGYVPAHRPARRLHRIPPLRLSGWSVPLSPRPGLTRLNGWTKYPPSPPARRVASFVRCVRGRTPQNTEGASGMRSRSFAPLPSRYHRPKFRAPPSLSRRGQLHGRRWPHRPQCSGRPRGR